MSAAHLPQADDRPMLARWMRGAAIAGVAGVLACVIGAFIDRAHFFRSWLLAFCLVLGPALGGLVVVMLHNLVGGNWGFVLKRFLEASSRTLPLVTLLFVPLVFGLHDLYSWTHKELLDPESAKYDKVLADKSPYLNVPFFLVRAAVYFAIWNLLAFLLNRWSRQQDTARSPALAERSASLSAPGLLLYVLTITFASIDWVMSLEPHWFSTIFMAIFGMGQVLSGFVLCIAALLLVYLNERPGGELSSESALVRGTLNDLGSLTFAFIMVWAYLSFSQFLLIWSADLPVEVKYYVGEAAVKRTQGGWGYVALALVVLHFALPFFLLLNTGIKRDPRRLLGVALWMLAMRVVEMVWVIVPSFYESHGPADASEPHHGPSVVGVLLYPAAVVGLGGLWLAYYLWQLQRLPLLPLYNPQEAAHGEVAHP